MSRLIIKNIPAYVTADRLKDHFQQASGPGGTLTDAKVAFKKDGTSRRFAFLGYKTEREATAAKEWFDKTFIDSSRISVSVVEGAKDAPAPRPNKRPRVEKTAGKKDEVEKSNGKYDKFEEFAKVMEPRTKKGPSWANEPSDGVRAPSPPEPSATVDGTPSDDDKQEGMSDLDWMQKRMKTTLGVEEKNFEQHDDQPAKHETSALVDSAKDTIMQTSRLFVRNLAFSCTTAELRELFEPFGELSQVHIPLDPSSKDPKGVGYVTFTEPRCACDAFDALDRTSFQGRLLHLLPAVDRAGGRTREGDEGKKRSVKDEKEIKRKAGAGRDFNWGMLYMNSDAVASSIAARMKIPKSDILNPDGGDNAAVRLALAETHVIQETKNYLISQGIDLSSLSSSSSSSRIPRSSTTILIKNIPYGTPRERLEELFGTYGALRRVLVVPAGTLALVEFERPEEARKAFGTLAYRRLGDCVLYLEWGPEGLFSSSSESPEETVVEPVRIRDRDALLDGGGGGAGEEGTKGGTTLYVKNLSFKTTSERLESVVRSLPGFAFARVQTKPGRAGERSRISMGYGFVGFGSVEAARGAMKGLDGYVLDGHALVVRFAGRGTEGEEHGAGGGGNGKERKGRTTKMIVKNVPFEASKKDIQQLFGAHGQLKSVRLPKKFDARSRGFAFLDFVSRAEAENVYGALRHTHLLGRHLVLEWAEEGEQDIELLREKAGVGFGGGKDVPGRKRKLDLGGDSEDLE